MFENLIVGEIVKQQYQVGWNAELYFWQESNKREIDLLMEKNGSLTAAEIKSAATLNTSFFDNLQAFQKYAAPDFEVRPYLIYGGDERQERTAATVRGWWDLDGIF